MAKKKRKKVVSKTKAKKILKDGKIGGKPLTKRQRGFFGARAGGVKRKRKTRKR